MNLSNSQLDVGLNLDYDKEKQEKTECQKRLKVYKFKYAISRLGINSYNHKIINIQNTSFYV